MVSMLNRWEVKSVNELRHMWKDMKEGQSLTFLFFCVTEHLQKTLSLLNPELLVACFLLCWLRIEILQVFTENLFYVRI